MANCVAPPLPAKSQGVSRVAANATADFRRTGWIPSPALPFGNHLGTVESENGRT
jgi:hypothetical protein